MKWDQIVKFICLFIQQIFVEPLLCAPGTFLDTENIAENKTRVPIMLNDLSKIIWLVQRITTTRTYHSIYISFLTELCKINYSCNDKNQLLKKRGTCPPSSLQHLFSVSQSCLRQLKISTCPSFALFKIASPRKWLPRKAQAHHVEYCVTRVIFMDGKPVPEAFSEQSIK